MRDINYYVDKLFRMASQFDILYSQKEYARAAYVYRKASITANFLELPEKQMSELFGYWPDDGDSDTEAPDGLFSREKVWRVDWECCVRQHKTYQDEACRRQGEPQRFYSDEDYCTLHCRHAFLRNAEHIAALKQ